MPRIAVVQFQIKHLDRDDNFKRIEIFVAQASAQKADIIVFPEDCITGSIFGDLTKLDTTHADRNAFCLLAKKYAIDIVTGSSMEGTPVGNFNTSYYINSNGIVLGTYSKNHLYPSEHKFLSPGTDAPVFDTKFGKAGIVICWDMLFPEIFQRLKSQGAQIIFCPSYWYQEIAGELSTLNPTSESQQLDALCITRSLETNSVLVYANAAGTQSFKDGSSDTLIGHSQIVFPALGPIKKLNHNHEEMFIQEVDLMILEKTKKIYQT